MLKCVVVFDYTLTSFKIQALFLMYTYEHLLHTRVQHWFMIIVKVVHNYTYFITASTIRWVVMNTIKGKDFARTCIYT